MKLKFISILALTFIVGTVVAADTPPISIAVFNFTSPYGIRLRNDIGVIGSLLTVNLSSNPQFTLVDRAQLNKILKEQAFGLSGDISPETAAKIGRLVGAKILVTGQILTVDEDIKEYDPLNGKGEILIVANVIGTETGRIFAQREQGSRENLVKMADDLSAKISEAITNQYTNFVAAKSISTSERLAEIINNIQGKTRPAVSIQINEQILRMARPGQTVQTEFGVVFKEAGFEVVDEKSDKQADVLITGTATSAMNGKVNGGLISASASLTVKAQDRLTGKILLLDRQDATGVDLNRQTAAKKALQEAADSLAGRMLPVLAK
jgi:Curli production assembly/transport component CsgG